MRLMSTAEIIAELPRLTAVERAQVQAKLAELDAHSRTGVAHPLQTHPALGVWKDRTDLVNDAVGASRQLRNKLMGTPPA